MILTVAKGSLGHYYLGEDGRIYTSHSFHIVDPDSEPGKRPVPHGTVAPGERPDPHVHRQYGGATPFWLPTGQTEPIEGEQAESLEEARELLDLHWMVVEAREQVECPECGKAALRDERVHVDGRTPFVCEERHLTIDETETPEPIYEKA